MSTQLIKNRIKNRVDTLVNWNQADPQLLAGEIAFVHWQMAYDFYKYRSDDNKMQIFMSDSLRYIGELLSSENGYEKVKALESAIIYYMDYYEKCDALSNTDILNYFNFKLFCCSKDDRFVAGTMEFLESQKDSEVFNLCVDSCEQSVEKIPPAIRTYLSI